ncbi:ketopantoate reductase family protein [Natronobacterium gregoryi]|uniref:2-dehydropantoate 2-reductase n=2 Tax=Natronobacterium gregoryi TaxID=44930 RepID=L0AFT0_NATGS|nr:2-dehydropantoate 2-reductase [Natronobacterium gregoryi]AFZ72661.1 2-dehydropantoate 2-reductase [Natronobacterium gregoryi SP2]ELY69051.1 2-dehydropantoate 2-reductase [Natronobacterium gregoryi SP2]PLK20613.1 2-dehydropantoate 2-reductase [Natronobacterium gregoryi SP2]SFI90917.1 ketopantoate reductase [Natronobacterium gregoryi]
MEIVVFGAGSLGSLVGGILAGDHDVTLVARREHAQTVHESGLRIDGELETQVTPAATTDGRDLEGDLAVVTVKSFDTPSIAETIATGSFEVVLSLQNGMGNEESLASALESPVLAGTATYGAILREPGLVECTGIGDVVVGDRRGGTSNVAETVGEAFSSGGLETTVAADMPYRLWEKLAVNAGINAVTALTETENRAVLESPTDHIARAATKETARVARADGVDLSNREALVAMESVAEATATNTSSMAQDLQAGRRTEIDAINGYVVDRGDELGLETPTNRLLAALVRTWERGQELRNASLSASR